MTEVKALASMFDRETVKQSDNTIFMQTGTQKSKQPDKTVTPTAPVKETCKNANRG